MRAARSEAGPAAGGPVERYLTQLEGAVLGRRGGRRPRILREIRDHLDDATRRWLGQGLAPLEAERRAVAQAGAVPDVAPALRRALALQAAHRALISLLVVLPVLGLFWNVLMRGDETSAGPLPPLIVAVELASWCLVGAGAIGLGASALALRRCEPSPAQTWLLAGGVAAGAAVCGLLAVAINLADPRWESALLTLVSTLAPLAAVGALAVRALRLNRG